MRYVLSKAHYYHHKVKTAFDAGNAAFIQQKHDVNSPPKKGDSVLRYARIFVDEVEKNNNALLSALASFPEIWDIYQCTRNKINAIETNLERLDDILERDSDIAETGVKMKKTDLIRQFTDRYEELLDGVNDPNTYSSIGTAEGLLRSAIKVNQKLVGSIQSLEDVDDENEKKNPQASQTASASAKASDDNASAAIASESFQPKLLHVKTESGVPLYLRKKAKSDHQTSGAKKNRKN